MEKSMYRVCLTGHRPKDVAQFMPQGCNPYDLHNQFWMGLMNNLLTHIKDLLDQHPEGLELHSGMALGADMAWAGVIVVARNRFGADKIRFVADCPLPTQASRWPQKSQAVWQHVVSLADTVNYVTEGAYYPSVMEERNQMMIKDCDECIAFWSGKDHGGTYNGVQDARKNNVQIFQIKPQTVTSSGKYLN